MNWTHLRRVLRFAATHLDGQLDALQPGARWRKHLAVGAIRDQVAEDVNRPPDRKARERLQEIVKAYDATARKPEYGAINGLWGFRAVHATLAEFVSPPWDRERRQLAASARELDRQLDEIGAGQRWHEHLALPDDVFAPAPIPDPINTPNQANVSVASDPRKLRDVLTRFDAVGRNAKYRSIAGLPSFQATHEILGNYVSHFVKVPPPPPLP